MALSCPRRTQDDRDHGGNAPFKFRLNAYRRQEYINDGHSSGLSSAETIELFEQYVIPNYTSATRSRWCAAKARTSGTARGTAISTSSPAGAATCWAIVPEPVVEAVQEQVATLIHVPNTWYTEAQGRWAETA